MLHHFTGRHAVAAAHDLPKREHDTAVPADEATWLIDDMFRPTLLDDSQRSALIGLAEELGIATSDYALHRTSSHALFERVRREVELGSVRVLPMIAGDPEIAYSSEFSEDELDAADAELRLLHRVYGGLRDRAGTHEYVQRVRGRTICDAARYLRDRSSFIASGDGYAAYVAAAHEELESNHQALRWRIDPPANKRPSLPNWTQAQDVFYAWTRRAYEHVHGKQTNVPALINAGMSDELRAALQQVHVEAGIQFKAGGFNPRPMKIEGSIRLGTLSNHAAGTAIDIDASSNAQFELRAWQRMLAFTGQTLDGATRKRSWAAAPEELYRRIQRLNDTFVDQLRQVTASAGGPSDSKAFERAIAADPNLSGMKLAFVLRWRAGFFNLPWPLVRALHRADFVWGATFERPGPDLHHFELRKAHERP